jgi:Zn-dependent protease with chaperone function
VTNTDVEVARTQRRRERRHGRWLLIGLSSLIVLSTSPVLGHHVVGAVDWLPATLQHAGNLCLVALHMLLAPVHSLFHWLLGAGLVLASVDRARAIRKLRAQIRDLPASVPGPGDGVWEAARLAGLPPQAVRKVTALPIPAFTAGLVRPKVYVSADLPSRLSTEELAAVLAHEGAHRARRDPLRLSALRFLAHLLFWIPALRRVADDLADEAEIEADTAAARRFPLDLASALVALAGGPSARQTVGGGVPFQSYDLLERRVKRLAGVEAPIASRVSRRSIVGAAAVLMAAWVSGVMVLHPLPEGSAAHCTHHAGHPATHLFCRGITWRWSDSRCPHSA